MSVPDAGTTCNICSKAIHRNHRCTLCKSCRSWHHLACNNLSRRKVDEKKMDTFICIQCNELLKKEEDSSDEVDQTDMEVGDEEGEFEEFKGYQNYSDGSSEFELARLENMKKNQEMFDQLDIKQAKTDVSLASKRQRNAKDVEGVGVKRAKKPREILPPRKSLRVQKMHEEGTALASFRYQPPVLDKWVERKPVEMDMDCVNDIEDDKLKCTAKEWLKDNDLKFMPKIGGNKHGEDFERYNKYKEFQLSETNRVTKSRAYCITWHPSKTKRLLCQGDKKGSIGIWDIDYGNGEDGVFMFDVHAPLPISCLTFDPFDSTKIYSSCYDGTLTCGDFNQMKFLQTFAYEEDHRIWINHFAWPKGKRNTVVCATTSGQMVTIDLSSGKAEQTFTLKEKRAMRCIDCHPMNEHLIACSHNDGTLAMWDWRMLSKSDNKKKCLSSFKAERSIVKTYFSPQTGNKLLMTSQDDHVRVLDVDKSGMIELRNGIKHKNYFGRWVTTFRSTWDPKTDNIFTCGSLEKPRQVDLFGYNEKGKLMSGKLTSENFNNISPINVFHPHLDLLASNSSGRVLLWSLPPV